MQHYQPASSPLGFGGCMFCGAPDHVFRSCPQHETPCASAIFYKHLFAHKPHLHGRPPLPSEIAPTRHLLYLPCYPFSRPNEYLQNPSPHPSPLLLSPQSECRSLATRRHRELPWCDLTGFLIVNATHNNTAHDLARLFVQEVLLKIGFCGLVVVDDMFAVILFASPDWRWCYLNTLPQVASGVFFFIIPVALCILAMTVLTVISIKACTASKVDERSETKILGESNVLGICVVPCRLILYAVWPIQFAAFVMLVPILFRDIIGSIS